MANSALLDRARDLWVTLAGAATTFPASDVRVTVAVGSRLCPPGWAGIVVLGDAGIATAPDAATARFLREALAGRPARSAVHAERWSGAPGVADVLGPAALAYLDEKEFKPATAVADVEWLRPGHPDIGELLAGVSEEEAAESGIDDVTSSVFVIREGGRLVAAAGYRRWPSSVAHLSVLTSSHCRGRGLAGAVASAAVAEAQRNELLPQWRARPEPSQRLARRLGFCQLGTQVSIRVAADHA
ncbi:GNAT family N-acetyltransferase [Micromonospora sp. NPDC048999]|uniref:GNAT family N-acetyltransferase n=1 Tax=Micromonospora sp. NPDC048999 TaxID=3155391 RepID=UPI0033D78D09